MDRKATEKREQFVMACGGFRASVEFEQQVLSVGREFLPDYVKCVLDDDADRGVEYWEFLLGQVWS